MGARFALYFPFVLAVLMPPVGVLLGLIEMQQDREAGMRIIAVAVLAALVWVSLFIV